MSTAQQHWKNYILLLSTAFYGAGIVFSAPLLPHLRLLPYLLIVPAGACLLFILSDKWFKALPTLALLFFVFGLIQGNRYRIPNIDNQHIAALVSHPQQAIVIGTLSKMVSIRNDISRARVKVSYLRTGGSDIYLETTGAVDLSLRGNWPAEILPGHPIAVKTTLQPTPASNVPGAFNYRKYLARSKVYVTGWIQSPLLIQRVEPLDQSVTERCGYAIERLRYFIGEQIRRSLPGNAGALYRALLIGDRSAIQKNHYETLKRAGVLHILAISGMHLGLLAAITYTAFYWLLRRSVTLLMYIDARKYALFLTLPLLLVYALLAGFQAPVVRSLIMSGCMVIGYGINRLQSPLTSISFSALLILLLDPIAIESPSFQLSFCAVTAIFLLAPKIKRFFDAVYVCRSEAGDRIKTFLLTMSAVSLAATLGTLPLMLVHFNRSSLVALPANLIIEPLVCLVSLPIGFISIPFMFILPDLSGFLLSIGALGLKASMTAAARLSSAELSQLWLPAPHPVLCLLYYLSLTIMVGMGTVRIRLCLGIIGIISAISGFVLPLTGMSLHARANATVSIIDVGHGSAHIIEMRNGRVVVVDAGAKNRPGYDCGAQLIAPFIWSRGIGKVDDIILTHDDADHYSGVPALIRRFRPDRLWIPALSYHKPGFSNLLELAVKFDVRILTPEPGMIIGDDKESISVIGFCAAESTHRMLTHRSDTHGDDNGLVLKFSSAQTSILFPGDITKKRERAMVSGGLNLKSDILLSPHHGSPSSNSYEFLSTVDPDYIIFSSGDEKNMRFPNRQVLSEIERLGISSLNTAHDGTISIRIAEANGDDPYYRIDTFNISDQIFWRQG